MDWLAHLLTDVSSVPHIILVYSLVIAVGALLGRIRLFGVSLGVTFVLFAAIAAGHFGFTVNPAVLYFLRDFGLTVFIYFIGLQVGPSFFSSFKSGGMVLNLLTVLQVLLGVAVTIALYILFKDTLSLPQMLGVHYGAVTNTPGLGATQETLELFKYTGENIAVAYACAYPLGVIVGSVPFAVPGLPVPLKLGLAGGPLIVAILLGRFGPTMRLVTFTTPSANMMMRETGICLFLASVGLAAGDGFVAAMTDGNGPLYMALGVLITVIPLLIVGVIARRFLHINYHSIVGLMAGATTDPPALAYAGTLSERNSSAVAYSTVYPLAMFLRILMGQLILVILWPFL